MLIPLPHTSVVRVSRTAGGRGSGVGWLVGWVLVVVIAGVVVVSGAGAASAANKIISLNPSLTAMLLALGQADRLVGVDDFSARQISEVSHLPRVGGLFNPSLEAVVALEPDLVVLVPSAEQRDFRNRLLALNIEVEVFQNVQFDQVLENITRLGRLTGAEAAAAERVAAIVLTRTAVERVVASRAAADGGSGTQPRPTIAVVVQRDPLFVVGGANFIDSMLQIAGTQNIAADYREPYPRIGMEWLIAASPQMLLDLSPDTVTAEVFWKRWPNIAAVKNERIISLDAALISMPGPDLDRSLRLLASTFWGAETLNRIRQEEAALAGEQSP